LEENFRTKKTIFLTQKIYGLAESNIALRAPVHDDTAPPSSGSAEICLWARRS